MKTNKLTKRAFIFMLSLAYSVCVYAAPNVSEQVLNQIEQERFLEIPFDMVLSQIAEKLNRAGYTSEQAQQLAQEILNFQNNSLKVSEIVAKFNAKLDQQSGKAPGASQKPGYRHLTDENVKALFKVNNERNVVVTLSITESEGIEKMNRDLEKLKLSGALVKRGDYDIETYPVMSERIITLRTKDQAQDLMSILAEFQDLIGSVKFSEVAAEVNSSKHLNDEVLAQLNSVSNTSHISVQMYVIGIAEADKMDSDLNKLRQLGLQVEGNGFPLESMPPQGGRKVVIKTPHQAKLFIHFLKENSAPITQLEITKLAVAAPAAVAPQQVQKPIAPADMTKDREMLEAIYTVGAVWAVDEVKGQKQDPKTLEILRRLARLIPYGRTLNGVRTESEVFRVEHNSKKLIFLRPTQNRLQIMFGAPVSEAMMQLAEMNSAYIFNPAPGNEKFIAVLNMIAKADLKTEKQYGRKALKDQQDPFNREVQIINGMLVTNLDMKTDITDRELAYFLSALYDLSCEDLLSSMGK